MLGRLQMGVDECIDAYLQISDNVFQKKRHAVNWKGKIQGKFDSGELERAMKQVVRDRGLRDDVLLKDAPNASCKVWVDASPGADYSRTS